MSGAQLINTTINVPLITNKLTGTGERDTGYTYDGKTVYTKTYTGTSSATDGNMTIDTIFGLSHIVSHYGYWIYSDDNYTCFNRTDRYSSVDEIRLQFSGDNLIIRSIGIFNSCPFHLSVYYTK